MGQERSGFLHPAGALSKREKTGPSSPPARPEEPLYPSNDPREGRVPAGWKSASSHPARPGRRPPLTPPKAMKQSDASATAQPPAASPAWLTEEDWEMERSGRLVRRERKEPSKPVSPAKERTVPEDRQERSVAPEIAEAIPPGESVYGESTPPAPAVSGTASLVSEEETRLFSDLLGPDALSLLEDPEDWPEDGEDALPDEQIPEPAAVPVSLLPETRTRRKWPWIAAVSAAVLTAGGIALWKTGLWNRLLERLS